MRPPYRRELTTCKGSDPLQESSSQMMDHNCSTFGAHGHR